MTSMPSDQAVHATAWRTYCAELALPTLVTGAVVYVGSVWTWQVCLLASIPVTFGIRHIFRTREVERRWAVTRWLAAETQWRHRQAAAVTADIEDTDPDRRPSVVDGQVVEAQP